MIPLHEKCMATLVCSQCLHYWKDFSLTSYSLHLIMQSSSLTDASPVEEYPELEGNFMHEEGELKEDREEKEVEIPENANTEKISLERLLKVFQGGKEVQDANRFTSHLQIENTYSEVG